MFFKNIAAKLGSANQQFKAISNHKNGAISKVQRYKIIWENSKELTAVIRTSTFILAATKKAKVTDNKILK